jgi:hypothetical protein
MSDTNAIQSAIDTVAVSEPDADGQYDLFTAPRKRAMPERRPTVRWHEFDDAVEEMGTLGLSDRMKSLAITPVLLDELACVRDEWRWPTSLDTIDLLMAKDRPARTA